VGATYSQFAGLPVPDTAAINDVPYWISQLAAELDTQVVLQAASTADRDSKYFPAPAGVLCTVTDPSGNVIGVYVKTSPAGTSVWSPVWTAPSAPLQVDVPLADGLQAANGKSPIAVYNEVANTWTFWGNVAFANGGNIPNNTILGTIPAAVQMSTVQPFYEGNAPTSVGGTGSPSGTAKISLAVSGNIVVFLGSGVAPGWVGLDGITVPGA
jgi:hypothetical protein